MTNKTGASTGRSFTGAELIRRSCGNSLSFLYFQFVPIALRADGVLG